MTTTIQGMVLADGRFVPDNLQQLKALLPRRATLQILENETKQAAGRNKVAVLDKIFEDAGKAESELSDADWAEFETIRSQSNFARDVDL